MYICIIVGKNTSNLLLTYMYSKHSSLSNIGVWDLKKTSLRVAHTEEEEGGRAVFRVCFEVKESWTQLGSRRGERLKDWGTEGMDGKIERWIESDGCDGPRQVLLYIWASYSK